MYTFGITIALCVLAGCVQAEPTLYEPTFEVTPDPYVIEGASLTMKCAVNTGPAFMASRSLQITHKSLKSGVEETISEQGNLVSKYQSMGFTLQFDYDPVCSVTITINDVTADMDGEFHCQVKTPTADDILEHVVAPVTVLGGISKVELTVENEVIDMEDKTLAYKPGKVSVGCVAFGSNPAPVVYLKIGDTPITGDITAMLDEESSLPRRSFKGAVNTMLDFTHEMFGKKLSCNAGVEMPEGVPETFPEVSSFSAILDGIVDEPTIECTNNTASVGDRKITLKCKVSKVPKVKSIFFNIGNQRMIYPGNSTEDLMECKINDLDTDNNEIVLQFYQMKDWHFTANIYLEVLGYDGSEFQYPVYLIKESVSGAATMAASLFVLACSILAMMSVLESS